MQLRAPKPASSPVAHFAKRVYWGGGKDENAVLLISEKARRLQRWRRRKNPGAANLFLQSFFPDSSRPVSKQGLRAREQTGQGEERCSLDYAGRNMMPSESKRFSGTTVLLSVDSGIFRTIGK